MHKTVTVTAFDKDTNRYHGETFALDKDLPVEVKKFEDNLPFRRYFIEAESNAESVTAPEWQFIVSAGLDQDLEELHP